MEQGEESESEVGGPEIEEREASSKDSLNRPLERIRVHNIFTHTTHR